MGLIICFITTAFSPFLLIVLPGLLFAYILLLINEEKKKGSVLPPGPARLPFIGNLHQLRSLTPESIKTLSNQYGPILFWQLGSISTLVISSADAVKDIFKTHDLIFSGRPQLYVASKLTYNYKAISFSPYGDYWREMRKIAILEMLSSKRIQSFKQVREQEMKLIIDFIARSSPQSVNLNELVFSLANNVVSRVIFGKKYGDAEDGFDEVMHEAQALLGGFCLSDYFPWMRSWVNKFNGLEAKVEKNFRKLDKLYDRVIQTHLDPRRTKPENEDVVDVLLRIKRDSSESVAITDEQIKGVLTDLFSAGTDTSASTLVWIMTELIRNPSAMRRAQEEIRGAVKSEKELRVEEDDLSKLIYLKLVIKESLRLHPPLPFLVPRETRKETSVLGYKIPNKTRVLIDAKSIGKDPKYWDNPNEFKPERFLDNSVDFRGQHFEFIPFGVGRRSCPGINFGVLLIEFVLANLLHGFDWELPEGMTKEDVDMEEVFGLAVFKKTPLRLIPKPVNA